MITKQAQTKKIAKCTREYFEQHKTGPMMIPCDYLKRKVTGNECRLCRKKSGKCNEVE